MAKTRPPLVTCESVISECCFLLRYLDTGSETILKLMERGLLKIEFDLNDELLSIRKLLVKYRDIPISLADACLVRMSE